MPISIRYVYNRIGTAAGPPLSALLSHHHVISYPYMYYLGVAALCYFKKMEVDSPGSAQPMIEKLNRACQKTGLNFTAALNGIVYDGIRLFRLPEDNTDIRNALAAIAWMPMNLFIGPCCNLRCDDPSQGMEKLPEGMPYNQKIALNNIITAIRHYNSSAIPHTAGAGGATNSVTFERDTDFSNLMKVFFENISGNIRCYDSKISDWLIAYNSKYYKIFFYTGKNAEQLSDEYSHKKLLFEGKFLVKNEPKTRPEDNQTFKVIVKNTEKILGIITPSSDDQQSHTIKDYLK